MIDFEKDKNWTKDVNLDQMSVIAQEYLKYKSQIIDNPKVDQIKKFLINNQPVIVPSNGKVLYQENKFFKDGGPYYHNIVILGFDDDKQKFIVHDVGTQHGAYFKYSYDLLMDSIHDFPTSGDKSDINLGAKRVLVLIK